MRRVKVGEARDRVSVGDRFTVSFQRTLRIPEDDQSYPLPPSLGTFTIHRVEDHLSHVPPSWRARGGFFIAMYQREALWLGFSAAEWKPSAVQVSAGGVNALSGTVLEEGLHSEPQDYIVCPDQPWLDGMNAGEGVIRQFVAMPLGGGYTVEAQLTESEEVGGLQLIVYEPKPGIFPDEPPAEPDVPERIYAEASPAGEEMGLGVGGKIKQKIYPDRYGVEVWDQSDCTRIFVHILNSEEYRRVAGAEPPPTPVSAETYARYGLPWFDLYDESKSTLPAPDILKRVQTVGQKEHEKQGRAPAAERGLEVGNLPVEKLRRRSKTRRARHTRPNQEEDNSNE